MRPNEEKCATELHDNWEVLGEPIQTVMRAQAAAGIVGMEHPYERVKSLMRGERINRSDVEGFIRTLPLTHDEKEQLLALTPESYIGLAPQLVDYADGRRANSAGDRAGDIAQLTADRERK